MLGIYAVYSLGVRHQRPVILKPSSLSNVPAKTIATGSNGSANNSSQSSSNSGSTSSGGSGSSSTSTSNGAYQDGTYVGSAANAYYGNVQVSVSISGGRITDVKFLQYPNTHPTSVYINSQAIPYLKQETIQSQNANVQIISGATFTSEAFIQSLQSALSKA